MAYIYQRTASTAERPSSYNRTASFGKFALNQGESFENDRWRVWRGATGIKLTDLQNAGKKGKTCDEWYLEGDHAPLESIGMELVMLAKRGADQARMRQSLKEMEEVNVKVHESNHKGVDVKPGNFQKLFVRGALITVEADYSSYSIQDITDDDNEPTCIAKGKRSVFQFYRWVKDNARAIQSMSMHDALTAMKAAGIDYHYFCAVD